MPTELSQSQQQETTTLSACAERSQAPLLLMMTSNGRGTGPLFPAHTARPSKVSPRSSSTSVRKADLLPLFNAGLHFLSSTLLCSTAVDQRLNVYRLDLDQGGAPKLAFAAATCLGVADCSAMDVIADAAERATLEDSNGEGYRSWTIVSVGIGAEVTRVEL